jgi:putative FmdB family regulatory protein
MPIYVYRCQACQEYTEALQKASDPALIDCPHCGAPQLQRVIAPVGVIFKGTGFHKNDYSAKPSSSSSSPKTSESTTESKPAETTSTPAAAPAPSSGEGA